ncbi:MAG: IS1634 family transposase [Candidatus Omnitrophica bacterium]|nr:IS1634 family transposase [Candidatus Omnitrophota bacterium]
MVYQFKQKVKGKYYVFLGKNKRIGGRSVRVWSKSLGPLEKFQKTIRTPPEKTPKNVSVLDFGGPFAFFALAKKLGLVDIINKHVSKRKEAVSAGEYILLIVLNRCLDPCSKQAIQEWYMRTALPRLLKIPEEMVRSDNLCRQMDFVVPVERQVQDTICQALIEQEKLDVACLFYDATNQYLFVDEHKGQTLAQRGANKAKRFDLRQINIALLVSRDGDIPLLHDTYAGNVHDVIQFRKIIDMLVERFVLFSKQCQDITVIFDKGNNSAANLQDLAKTSYHFVGSLKPYDFKELLEIPLKKYTEEYLNKRGQITRAHRLSWPVFGVKRIIILTFDEQTKEKNLHTLHNNIRKRYDALQKLQEKINRGLAKERKSKWRKLVNIKERVEDILDSRTTKGIIQYRIEKSSNKVSIRRWIDSNAWKKKTKDFGKNILFTDKDAWNTTDIIAAYRNKDALEKQFQLMKDSHIVSLAPNYHWLDDRIRIHVFTCVLALQLIALLKRRLQQHKINVSVYEAIEQLQQIKEVSLSIGQRRGTYRVLTELSESQKKLVKVFGLEEFC